MAEEGSVSSSEGGSSKKAKIGEETDVQHHPHREEGGDARSAEDAVESFDGANKRATQEEDPNRPKRGYEYLDHTADVQLHAWGTDLSAAFEECAKAMFGYMTDLDTVSECKTEEVSATGHDLDSALFNFLDEWLFLFSAEPFFIPFKIDIIEFERTAGSEDSDSEGVVTIKARGFGETFDLEKHPQGTEVKAITYSAMQILEKEGFAEVFVIIDI